MRRALCMVCLCLVSLAALRLWMGDASDTREAHLSASPEGEHLLSTAEGELMCSIPEDGEHITVTGRVSGKDTKSFSIESVLRLSEEQTESISEHLFQQLSYAAVSRQTIPMDENLICEYDSPDAILLGSIVVVQGKFSAYSEATNPGEFDVSEYYHSLGVGGKLSDVTVLACSRKYSRWREVLWQLREDYKARLYRVFPPKEASVLTAMLLGDKEKLDKGIKELYRQNGIIHILSISGLHITMIGMSIYRLLRRWGVPVWLAALCGGCILCLYGVMTGMSVSACRAIGMYLIRMLAQVVGRTYDMLTALGVMAVMLVWQNPENLHNAGFLLSFGSILGIGWFYPALLPEERVGAPRRYEPSHRKRILKGLLGKWLQKLLQSMLASASITLFTLPIQLWFYYEVPVYSVFLNLLVLPLMSLLMFTGLIAMLLPGTGMVGTVTYLILQGYEWLCEGFEQLPFHMWNPGKPQAWQVVAYYLILLLIVLRTKKKVNGNVNRKTNGKASRKASRKVSRKADSGEYAWKLCALTLAVIVLTLRIRTGTTVTFLDVGQGDGIVAETSSGEVFLFDCGSSNRSKVGEYVLLPFLKCKGIRQLDAVFVSHPDEDHCSGIVELLEFAEEEKIKIGQLVLPDIAEPMQENEFASLREAAEGYTISYVGVGDAYEARGTEFLCLHPPKGCEEEDSNAYSLCFYVSSKDVSRKDEEFSFLLTGDVEGAGEELLLQELQKHGIDEVTVLKVAHHGSRNSSGEAFLQQIHPRIAIISCGRNNRYGHPHAETLRRLEQAGSTILATPEYGALSVEIGREIQVRGWRNPD